MNNKYIHVNGTSYHVETGQTIIDILESARINRTRLVIDLGDAITGKSWNKECNTTGYIGRSTGSIKIPLLIHNARSMGGGGLLDHCIVKIMESKGKRVLYQHPTYSK